MESVETLIQTLVQECHYPPVSELFATLSGGKRLRARLILMIAPEHPQAPLLGAIVELIHAASLLHDDVIDEASLRRGRPSVNATDGSKMAIMLGDVLYSKAFSTLSTFGEQISSIIADAVTQLSIGEMMDVALAQTFNTDEALYLDMLYRKTAVLIEASARAAAILASKEEDAYALYGRNLGLAFQIVDDILDIISDEATLGKPALNDFVEGKTTLPYMDLYHLLTPEDQTRLCQYHKHDLTEEQKGWIRHQMQMHGSIQRSYARAQALCSEASICVDEESLRAILETVIQRRY